MKIALLLAGMAIPLAAPAEAPDDERPGAPPSRDDPFAATPNRLSTPPGCESIPRQVAGEDRRYEGTRLDQQPPGKTLFAVHRRVDGCPVATFVSEERARRR